ncbi:cupin domain-containing protein [Deinococcus aquiradiocola]|uniref:Cupin n=1 Tax=Deinococcus aquiradiocola TaxID=393059 RepID=A0A917PIC0_9DEIO|nr:cupin domain-containing protein [Deinococcus aquiradiocola]GGJ79422.1 cupin [Deinococcus aquiradiocola]
MSMPEVVNLARKFGAFTEQWSPKIVGELNGQEVRLARIGGEFVWHAHDDADELFLVIKGTLRMGLRGRDGTTEDRMVNEGELLIVPRGTEHKPAAESEEVWMLMFEPAGTLNTGTAGGERTVAVLERL